ncbi:MAG: ABC transporter permease [Microgenomates group bacterium]
MKIIYILWLRQIKRFVRSKSRIIGSVVQPLMFLLALGFGFGSIFEKAGGGSYIQFLAPGIIAMSVLFTSIFSGMEIIWDRQFGFLKETLVAPVSRYQIMLGRTLGGATVAFLQGCVVFFVALMVGFHPVSGLGILLGFIIMLVTSIIFTAFGIAIASKLDDPHGFQTIMNFLVQPLFFLSGALFPLDNLPKALGNIIRINPLSYAVDGMRGAFTGVTHFGLGLDVVVLGIVMFGMLSLGAYLFTKIQI